MITRPKIWTESLVILTLEDMIEQVYEEEKKPLTKQTIFLEKLFLKRRIPPQNLSEWLNDYPDNKEIRESVYILKKTLEYRAVEGATANRLNSFMVIFHLKNNHGWKDESTVHDDSKDKATEAITEIRNRLATRTKRNIRIKK